MFNKTFEFIDLCIDLCNDKVEDIYNFQKIKKLIEEEINDIKESKEYSIVATSEDGTFEIIDGTVFNLKQLNNLVFIQPLAELNVEAMNKLSHMISDNISSRYNKDNVLILIPYNIKMLKVQKVVQKDHDPLFMDKDLD